MACLWIRGGHNFGDLAGNGGRDVTNVFENWPVTQSSWHAQDEEEANMAASSK